MATKKQKRLAGEARARQREEEERQRNAMLLREAQERRERKRKQAAISAHAADNQRAINNIHKGKPKSKDELLRDLITGLQKQLGRMPTEDEVVEFITGDNEQRARILLAVKEKS